MRDRREQMERVACAQRVLYAVDGIAALVLGVPRVTLSPHEVRWQPPVPDFALSRVVGSNVPVPLSRERSDPAGPEVLLCLNGEVTISSDGGDVSLRGGQSPGRPLRDRPEPERLSSPALASY